MPWNKKQLIFSPKGEFGWMNTHAQVPTPLLLDDRIRVYFSSRPERKLSLTTFVDVDRDDPGKIIQLNAQPILQPGPPGTFDEHGIMPSCAVHHDGKVYLYYSGWSRGSTVPYTNSTGLAISDDGGSTFHKYSEGPILSKSIHDPYSATSPCVIKEGNEWHMWYCSGTDWINIGEKWEHVYDIKYANSKDGITWTSMGTTIIGQRKKEEAITRPYVIKGENSYQMWFCYRGSLDFRNGKDAYRIGYATSSDLKEWHRCDDDGGIYPSDHGWDDKMIAYPAILSVKQQKLLFYNGNDFGADGFGYAVSSTIDN